MGMAAPVVDPPFRRALGQPEPPSAAYLASQVWTAERVRNELRDERFRIPRYEFAEGELLVTPSSPAFQHQIAARDLFRLLDPYVVAHGLGEAVWSPSDVEVLPGTTMEPDLFVVPPDEARRLLAAGRRWLPVMAVHLVVEVLSPSTQRNDRTVKRVHYWRAGGPQYWVVDLDERAIEVSEPGPVLEARRYTREVVWHPAGAPEPLVIDVRAYFERALGPDDRDAE